MHKKVVIIGASGHAKVIADIVQKSGDEVVGFLDDAIIKEPVLGYKVLGTVKDYINYVNDAEFIIGIGNNQIRKRIASELKCKWYTAIHPTVTIGPDVTVDEGSCLMAGTVVNCSSHIGKHTIINTCSAVEHDCQIGDFCHLSPNSTLCGLCKLGENVWLGAGATVINCLSVCDNVVIGAGAVVLEDITKSGTYVGVPTKRKLD